MVPATHPHGSTHRLHPKAAFAALQVPWPPGSRRSTALPGDPFAKMPHRVPPTARYTTQASSSPPKNAGFHAKTPSAAPPLTGCGGYASLRSTLVAYCDCHTAKALALPCAPTRNTPESLTVTSATVSVKPGFHAVAKPLVASTAAALRRVAVVAGSARTEVKLPPRYTVDSPTAKAFTAVPSAPRVGLGSQAVAKPVAAFTAAALLRVTVLVASWRTAVKLPPRYTVVPDTASAFTSFDPPVGFGSHAVGAPLVASTATAALRGATGRSVGLSWVKVPPRYTVEPATASAFTRALGAGFHAVATPVVALTAAALVRATAVAPEPTVVNEPAR